MIYFCYFLFLVGLGFYVVALFHIGSGTGQTLFYVGTGTLLIDTVLLLLRANRLIEERKA
ncbi:MAG: hypothetical protein AMS25_00530 [Gemmatimonas sp. SM23_52]|nr:MAG: hypothetical protein AMS25_00530 [Gemmatimonas sp. SM23_52]